MSGNPHSNFTANLWRKIWTEEGTELPDTEGEPLAREWKALPLCAPLISSGVTE